MYNLTNLIFAIKAENLAKLKAGTRYINECQDNSAHITSDEAVEIFEPRSSKFNNIQQKSRGIDKINRRQANIYNMSKNNEDRASSQPMMSPVAQPGTSQMIGNYTAFWRVIKGKHNEIPWNSANNTATSAPLSRDAC
uniref:Uncharacterized protein n=1 Tax=Glossina austeni TaxID=7395 RepID=A0A1A9VLN3_GLOAU